MSAATSFHYHGSGKASGQTVSSSMSVTHQGCTGGISDSREGGFAIVAIGKTVWIQPNDKFWEFAGIPAALLPTVHGKWLAVTGTGSNSLTAAFAPFCNASKLVSALGPKLTGLVKGKTIKIIGHRALQLRNGSGRESIYVSISSKPEILRISNNGTPAAMGRHHARPALRRIRAPRLLAPPHPRHLGTIRPGRRVAPHLQQETP